MNLQTLVYSSHSYAIFLQNTGKLTEIDFYGWLTLIISYATVFNFSIEAESSQETNGNEASAKTEDATKSQEENSSESKADNAKATSKEPVPGEKRYSLPYI